MRRAGLTALVLLAAGPAAAHDAFGDLGPFYASLLHPLADPAQGLLLAAAAVLLARQDTGTVRPAYAALAATGAVAVLFGTVLPVTAPGIHASALAAAVLGLAALFGLSLAPLPASLVAAAIALAAGLAIGLPSGFRAGGLAALGGAAGIALATLLVWGLIDTARRRLGPVAVAVAGSWIAAVGIMVAVLPS